MARSILESRRTTLSEELAGIATQAEQLMGADSFDPEDAAYVALRESRESVEAQLADVNATIAARALALAPTPNRTERGEQISDFRRILREYDRGHSDRVDIEYLLRELQTGDPYFTPAPTRIQVATLPTITPTLDSLRQVAVGSNNYDFVVPPPPVRASTVPEGGQKPTRTWDSEKVVGTLETDAHIVDVSRQTLEDDATAERTLRNWMVEGVRLQQDYKAQTVVAGATGTLTASGDSILGALRAGKSALSGIGIRATTAHLNPEDAATADIDAMTSGHTGPEGLTTIWGMTIVENPAIAVGAPIVGDMRNAVYFVYRSAISTYLTDSGMTQETTPRDRFSHNLLGILGEGRSRVHIVQPQLLVKCTVTVTP